MPTTLNKIISKVLPKIKILFFFVNEPNKEVIRDFSVSLIFISFSDENKFNKEGKNKNAINNAIINPNNANNNAIINPNNSNNNTNNNANNANNANNNANNANINPNNANNANMIEPLPVDPLQTNDNVFSNFFSFFTGGNNNNNNNNNAIREQEIINEPVDVENLDGFEELPAYTSLDETENENP